VSESGDKQKQMRVWRDNAEKIEALRKKYPYVSAVRIANLAIRLGVAELEDILQKLPVVKEKDIE
jgi:ribosomal protein L18E